MTRVSGPSPGLRWTGRSDQTESKHMNATTLADSVTSSQLCDPAIVTEPLWASTALSVKPREHQGTFPF